MNKEDFQEWKDHPVTKDFYEAVEVRLEDAKEALSFAAGLDLGNDRFTAGMIHAYREIKAFRVQDEDQ